MPRLHLTTSALDRMYELPEAEYAEVLVGTAPYCQLSLPQVKGLAEVHACIVHEQQGYVLTDMNTPAGTLADGVEVRGSVVMRPGVKYRMGALCLTMEDEAAQPARAEVEAEVEVVEPAEQVEQKPRPQPQQVNAMPAYMMAPQQMPQQVAPQQVPVPVVNIVQMPMAGGPRKKWRPTHPLRQKELSVLMAQIHRRSRYNSCALSLLWLLLTVIMASGVIVFILPRGPMQKLVESIVESIHSH